MIDRRAISVGLRHPLILLLILVSFMACASCRRRGQSNANSNAEVSTLAPAGSAEAKQQAQALVDEGKELYKNDEDQEAFKNFIQAVALDPNNAEAHLWLGRSYGAFEQKVDTDESYKKAIELYKKRVQANANDEDAFFNLGEAYSFLHLDEEATRNYRQATKLKPDDEEAWYRLGVAETKLAQYPEAISAFQKALDLKPEDSRATDELENAQEGAQRIKEGKKHAEDMLKKQQENANANGNLNANSNSKAKPTPKPKRSPGKPF